MISPDELSYNQVNLRLDTRLYLYYSAGKRNIEVVEIYAIKGKLYKTGVV
jgi:hypothetical protein